VAALEVHVSLRAFLRLNAGRSIHGSMYSEGYEVARASTGGFATYDNPLVISFASASIHNKFIHRSIFQNLYTYIFKLRRGGPRASFRTASIPASDRSSTACIPFIPAFNSLKEIMCIRSSLQLEVHIHILTRPQRPRTTQTNWVVDFFAFDECWCPEFMLIIIKNTTQHNTTKYNTIQYNTIQYNTR